MSTLRGHETPSLPVGEVGKAPLLPLYLREKTKTLRKVMAYKAIVHIWILHTVISNYLPELKIPLISCI